MASQEGLIQVSALTMPEDLLNVSNITLHLNRWMLCMKHFAMLILKSKYRMRQ
jgi:hypothetical protein